MNSKQAKKIRKGIMRSSKEIEVATYEKLRIDSESYWKSLIECSFVDRVKLAYRLLVRDNVTKRG